MIWSTNHRIELSTRAKPVYQQPYREGHKTRAIEVEEVYSMLQDGFIQSTMAEWASPVLLVQKKNDPRHSFVQTIGAWMPLLEETHIVSPGWMRASIPWEMLKCLPHWIAPQATSKYAARKTIRKKRRSRVTRGCTAYLEFHLFCAARQQHSRRLQIYSCETRGGKPPLCILAT